MTINKTADECIVESATVLLKCFADSKLSLKQKQKFTKWIIWFFDYQDAINTNNQKQISFLEHKLNLVSITSYYKNALQEFKNANLFYNEVISFPELTALFLDYSTKQTIKTVSTFSNIFLRTMENHNIIFENQFAKNFLTLIYIINYHLSYIFKNFLEETVKTFIKLIKTKVFYKKINKEVPLINLILEQNKNFFNKIQKIQLSNFIYKLEDIFSESNQEEIDEKIKNLIFSRPEKMNITMNTLLKNNNIDFYNEIWKNDDVNQEKSRLLMHLFAYESYFVQGHDNQQIYEDLVLKNIIPEEKYWILLHKYKLLNKIKKEKNHI